jgi:hypothetical protein
MVIKILYHIKIKEIHKQLFKKQIPTVMMINI